MTVDSLNYSELKKELEEYGVELFNGDVRGHIQTGQNLNLNAISIGLGLERMHYDPEELPGLVYQPVKINGETIVLSEEGWIAVLDARTKSIAENSLMTTVGELQDCNLFDGSVSTEEITYE